MDDLLHEVFDFDVDTYATLIDVRVQIECSGQRNYSGRVYTVDPLTQRFGRELGIILNEGKFRFTLGFREMRARGLVLVPI